MTKRVLITGANKGIGLAIARGVVAEHDDTLVLLGCRDAQRGAAAKQQLVSENPSWDARVVVLELDVTSDDSVRAAAQRVATMYGQTSSLYGVVNNAGVGSGSSLGDVLAVNTLGVRRVCEAFIPLLEPKARIVNITSASGPNFVSRCSAARQATFIDPEIEQQTIDDLVEECLALGDDNNAFTERGLGDGNPYGLSKALANSYTLLLARTYPGLRINACTPGFIETDLTRRYAEQQGKTPTEMGMKSPAEGARTPLFLLFGEPEGNGRYYGSDAQRSPLDRYRSPGSPPFTG